MRRIVRMLFSDPAPSSGEVVVAYLSARTGGATVAQACLRLQEQFHPETLAACARELARGDLHQLMLEAQAAAAKVDELQAALDRSNAKIRALEKQPPIRQRSDAQYERVGLSGSAPDGLVLAARRWWLSSTHPDRRPRTEAAKAHAEFVELSRVLDGILRQRGLA
ncbi:hypothetical protein [Alsobacter sp. SYSU BS001988]